MDTMMQNTLMSFYTSAFMSIQRKKQCQWMFFAEIFTIKLSLLKWRLGTVCFSFLPGYPSF